MGEREGKRAEKAAGKRGVASIHPFIHPSIHQLESVSMVNRVITTINFFPVIIPQSPSNSKYATIFLFADIGPVRDRWSGLLRYHVDEDAREAVGNT